jgi:tetratricopeptide (TPR) repeat protein
VAHRGKGNQVHHSPAEQIAERIGVVRQRDLGIFRYGFAHSAAGNVDFRERHRRYISIVVSMDRLNTLKQLVAGNPSDSFARYGLAMEYAKAGQFAEAAAEYRSIIDAKPDYAAAYFQCGQALERLGRIDEAKDFYRRGIEVTERAGDGHARDQLQAALDALA